MGGKPDVLPLGHKLTALPTVPLSVMWPWGDQLPVSQQRPHRPWPTKRCTRPELVGGGGETKTTIKGKQT